MFSYYTYYFKIYCIIVRAQLVKQKQWTVLVRRS